MKVLSLLTSLAFPIPISPLPEDGVGGDVGQAHKFKEKIDENSQEDNR
jgi:hypothetical protein